MSHLTIFALLTIFAQAISAQFNCPSACFQGTLDNAGPAVADSFCPFAAGIVNPVYTPNCLCYTPQTYDGTPWLFCYTCGSVLSGNFADVCGTTPVTRSCPNQQDAITQACNTNGNINSILGALCDNGKPSAIVAGIGAVVTFFEPPLAEGALTMIGEGCAEVKGAQAISSTVSNVCDVWKTAGCGNIEASKSSSSGTSSSKALTLRLAGGQIPLYLAFAPVLGLLVY